MVKLHKIKKDNCIFYIDDFYTNQPYDKNLLGKYFLSAYSSFVIDENGFLIKCRSNLLENIFDNFFNISEEK